MSAFQERGAPCLSVGCTAVWQGRGYGGTGLAFVGFGIIAHQSGHERWALAMYLIGAVFVAVGVALFAIQMLGLRKGLLPLRVKGGAVDWEVDYRVGRWCHLIIENPNDAVVERAAIRYVDPRGQVPLLPRGWGFTWSTHESVDVVKELDIPAHDDATLDLFLVPKSNPRAICFIKADSERGKLAITSPIELGSAVIPVELRARGTNIPKAWYSVVVTNEKGHISAKVIEGETNR